MIFFFLFLLVVKVNLCFSESFDEYVSSISTTREGYALILSFPNDDSTSLPSKMFSVASSILLSLLTKRRLYLTEPVFFYNSSSLAKGTIDEYETLKLLEPVEIYKNLSCSESLSAPKTIYINSDEYFIPALYLNRGYSDILTEWFPQNTPFETIFNKFFSIDPLIYKLVNEKYLNVKEFYKTEKIIGIIIDQPVDLKLLSRCIIDDTDSIVNVLSFHSKYTQHLQEHFPKFLYHHLSYENMDESLFVELLFLVKHSHKFVLSSHSPLSQLILALSPNKQAVYLNIKECSTFDTWDPCYYDHSFKQFYQGCEKIAGFEFNPHDPIKRPLYLDTCKDSKMGIKIVPY